MIPKIIHYCWYGKKELSNLNNQCIESWQKLMPEYEIMKWDETNSNMEIPFMREAYKQGRFGYLIDHTRLFALKHYGGIFLDLDFLAIKSFDSLINHDFFLGMIDENQVGMGIIGSKKEDPHINALIKIYEDYKDFVDKPSTEVATTYFEEADLKSNFNRINASLAFYPQHVFYNYTLGAAYRGEDYSKFINQDCIAIHLWENTWIMPEFRDFWFGNPVKGYKTAIQRILSRPNQGFHYYKDLGYHILRHLKLKK